MQDAVDDDKIDGVYFCDCVGTRVTDADEVDERDTTTVDADVIDEELSGDAGKELVGDATAVDVT